MTLQFAIPLVVARALPIWALAARARAAGVGDSRLVHEEAHDRRRREVLVDCEAPMAAFVLAELRRLRTQAIERDEENLRIATSRAITAVEAAIALARDAAGGATPE